MRARLLAAAVMALALLAIGPPVASADTDTCATAEGPSLAALACESLEPTATLDPVFSDSYVAPLPSVGRMLAPAAPCRATDIVYYTATDWVRLAQKLRANASPCAQYYISIPALTTGRMPRPGEAIKIRALGPQMHAMAEIHWTGWTNWLAARPGTTWYQAGVEARNQMALAGYDASLGDIWAINELPSGVRTNAGTLRQNVRDFVHGLYDGDGSLAVPGLVWTVGIGHATADTTTYKQNLRSWLKDADFWAGMTKYVRFWSQEVYASTTNWGASGVDLVTRRDYLNDYLQHEMSLGEATAEAYAAMKGFLERTYTPLGNMAYWYASGFGFTQVPPEQMKAFVSSQVYAMRNHSARSPWRTSDSFGFAYAIPATIAYPPYTREDIVRFNGEIIDRTAAAIHDSDVPAYDGQPVDEIGLGACGGVAGAYCTADVDGAVLNPAWQIFDVWNYLPTAADTQWTTAEDTPIEFRPGVSDIDKDALPEILSQPAHGTVSVTVASKAVLRYEPAADFNGQDSFTYRAFDTEGALSAPATVTITITPVNDAPLVTLATVGPVDEGAAAVAVTASWKDVEGDTPTFAWTTTVGTLTGSGDQVGFAADDGPATATVQVTADDGNGGVTAATTAIVVRNVAPTVEAGPAVTGFWGLPVHLAGVVTDPSAADTTAGLAPTWAFGDLTTGTGAAVDHTYATVGSYTATLTATDKDGGTASDTAGITIGARTTAVVSTGKTALLSTGATVSARLRDTAGDVPLAGMPVAFAVGAVHCTAVTNAAGVASCTLGTLPLGAATLTIAYAGGPLYLASSTTAEGVAFAFPEGGGTFVVGDLAATGHVTLWSPSWWKLNPMTGGEGPSSFRGYAEGSEAMTCTGMWTTRPGTGPDERTAPEYVGVAVASSVTKTGTDITGTSAGIVVVHVDGARDGVVLEGTVVASLCG